MNNVPAFNTFLAISVVLALGSQRLSAAVPTSSSAPTSAPSTSQPSFSRSRLLAHAAGDAYWIARIVPGEEKADPLQTDIYSRTQSADSWQRLTKLGSPAIQLGDYKRDVAVLLSSGDWVLAWRGDSSTGMSLPFGAKVVALAGGDDALWAVGAVPAGADLTTKPATTTSSVASTNSSSATTTPIGPTISDATAPATTQPASLALFRLDRGSWTLRLKLPDEFRGLKAGDISMKMISGDPVLALRSAEGDSITLLRFSAADSRWVDLHAIELPNAADATDFNLLAGTNQPILWVAPARGAGFLYVWRNDRPPSSGAIALALPGAGNVSDRAVTVASERIRLVFLRDDKVFEQRYELAPDRLGQKIGEPAEVAFPAPMPDPQIVHWMNVAVMVVLLLVIFGTVRRRAQMQKVMSESEKLPLAPQGLRLLAGLVDALPLFVSTFIVANQLEASGVDVNPQTMGDAGLWPVLIAYAVVILHTMLLELFTGRSLGKWLFGLRVVTLTGQRPSAVAIVIRNLLRIVDLSLGFTLVMILYSPLRQRVGDIAAGTVVIRADATIEPTSSGDTDRPEE